MTLTSEPKDYPNGDLSAFDRHRHEYTAGGGGLSAGIITLWSGSVASIPSGWYLCDGNNGTPDLRDRFVLAAGGAANPGDSGGTASLSHSGGAVADVSLSGGTRKGGTTNPASIIENTNVHGHVFTQPSAHADSRPPFYALAYIMKA